MEQDLSHARQLIFNEASETEKVELRRKWLQDPTQGGVISKEQSVTDSFFIELIDDEREAIEEAAKKVCEATESARLMKLKADEKELSRKFAKLISGNIARVLNGELVFELPDSNYFYSVTLENGQFLLSVNNTPVERFQGNGDEIKSLAKLLAKNPQPKPAVAQVTEITTEQRLRSGIKKYIAALEELKSLQ